ncbi:MAG: 50S ribosomal protein L1 [Deltaproteobacteria bacterium]|nr:50S ribosomal protein L1 [Deltaproteobacteria bacterium]
MARHGKKYRAAAQGISREERFTLDQGIEKVRELAQAGFDESVDIAARLNVNPKHADQMVRGACVLPAGTGKDVRVLVFAKGDKEKEANEAGADFVGADDLAKKIQGGWYDFDKVIASPDMMAVVGRLGKLLGPRGLMPNPKVGTVTQNVGQAVREAKAGKVEFRVDKTGIIHSTVGRKSFEPKDLRANIVTLLETLMKLKPATVKGAYFKSITLSSTMGPGIRLDTAEIDAMLRA